MMGVVAPLNQSFLRANKNMGGSLVASGLFHLLILVIVTVGLPFVASEPIVMREPISVEIVDIDELTQTNKRPSKPKESASKHSPKMDSIKPPDLTRPSPPDIENDVAQPRDIAPPELLKKPEIKKPAKPKKPPKKKPAPPAPKENAFESLLKNLSPDVEDQPQEKTLEPVEEQVKPSPLARFSDHLTMSEEDALRRQLGQCWNVMSGAKFAEDLVVEIDVVMNPDRSVHRATILNQGRYNRDGHYRAAADAAVRALRNPRCSPLALPPNKYEQWKAMTIRFDPQEML